MPFIAGGHSFGKTHSAGDPSLAGPEPEGGEAIPDEIARRLARASTTPM